MGRLAARIVELAERYGEPSDDGLTVTSPLSREDLAAWTGASRAGVAHALQACASSVGYTPSAERYLSVICRRCARGRRSPPEIFHLVVRTGRGNVQNCVDGAGASVEAYHISTLRADAHICGYSSRQLSPTKRRPT